MKNSQVNHKNIKPKTITKMRTSQQITTIAPALVEAIAEMTAVKKDSQNPFLKNKYASLDAIIEASKPILYKYRLAAFQVVNDEGVSTVIMHASGEYIETDYLKIMSEVSKGLSAAQAVGVATTYAKRYQLGAVLNVSTDEDTDGQYGDNKELKPTPRPELKIGTKQFTDCVTALKGGYKITDIRGKYDVSPEVEAALNAEVAK